MKTLLAVAAITAAMLMPAKAQSFPVEMLGSWCIIDGSNSELAGYMRDSNCPEDGKVVVSPNGYTAMELSCRFTRKTRVTGTSGKFIAAYGYVAKCLGDGKPFVENGKIGVRYDDTLIIEYKR
jgi:hypothetical protein